MFVLTCIIFNYFQLALYCPVELFANGLTLHFEILIQSYFAIRAYGREVMK